MNQDNLSVPMPFTLLDVSVSMYWDHGSDAWIGVVDAEKVDWEKCSPNEQGLTGCRASDFDIIAGGPDSTEGMEWSLEPGTTRFITGGRAGTITLDTNIVTYTYSVGLGFWPGAFLAVVGLTLGLAGIQMAFPVKFRKSG